MSLRGRFLLFAMAVAVPLVIVGGVNLVGMWTANRAQLDDSIRQQAALAALTFDRWIDAQSEPVRVGGVLSLQENTTPGALANYLRYTAESHPSWIDIRLVDAGGKTRQVYPPGQAAPPSAVVSYLIAETSQDRSWKVTTDRTGDESQPVIVIGAPADEGGAVIARIEGLAVKELFQDIRLPEGAVIAVFDPDGRILYRRQTTETPIDPDASGSPLFAALGDRAEAVVEIESPYDGIRRVYGLARAERTRNVVIVGIPSSRLYEPARHRFTVYLSLSLLALLFAVVAALFIQRSITRPIERLARNATALGSGDLWVRASTKAPGEIGRLGVAFNSMAAQISERETRLTELDRLKSEFVGSVSHELRTPLTTIKTLTHVLLNSPPGEEEEREYLQTIAAECDRQIDLVANLLDLSRIESGGYPVTVQPVEPDAVLASAISFGKHGATARGQTLNLVSVRGLPLVAADARTFGRVLGILIENAVKYSPVGGTIAVTARVTGDELAVSVADNGRGVNHDDRPHLFEKFFRGRPALDTALGEGPDTDPDRPGIGLGLYIAAKLVEQLNGRIMIEDRPGPGATFTIYMPLWQTARGEHDVRSET